MMAALSGPWGALLRTVGVLALLYIAASKIYQAGYNAADATWTKRELQAVQVASDAIRRNAQIIVTAERLAAQRMTMSADKYLKEARRAKQELDRVNACLRDGHCRMYVRAPGDPGGGTAVPGAAGPTGGRDGAAATELPAATGMALRDLASEADEVVRQLTAAQENLRAVLAACRATTPPPGTPPG